MLRVCVQQIIILIFFLSGNGIFANARFAKVAKITEGVDKLVADSGNQLQLTIPDSFYGPEILSILVRSCFMKSHERYEYTVCPFHNITQRRVGSTSVANLLGVWGHWELEINQDSEYAVYSKLRYFDGELCGIREKRSFLNLRCDQDNFEITNVDDSVHCDFNFEINVPIPCSMLR